MPVQVASVYLTEGQLTGISSGQYDRNHRFQLIEYGRNGYSKMWQMMWHKHWTMV